MMRYFVAVLGGIVQLGLILVARAEQPVRIPVAEQSLSKPGPADAKADIDQGRGPLSNDDESDRVLDGHFTAGAGAYIMKPFFENNPAFFTVATTTTTGPATFSSVTNQNQHDFDWGMDAAPVVWLGYTSECGLGVRARWWLFDQRSATSPVSDHTTTILSASPARFSIESPGPTAPFFQTVSQSPMLINSSLKLVVWDFEATGETEVGRWILLFSGGFRYAHLSQEYGAFQTARRAFSPPFGIFIASFNMQETDLLSAGHNFNGAGPTLALEAKRRIGNSGLSLFANLRGTILFGETKQQVDQLFITQNFAVTSTIGGTQESHRDTVLPVAELEMGAEFSRNWGAVRPFLRTGLVAQTWFGAGSATDLTGNLGFLGLSVTAGLTY